MYLHNLNTFVYKLISWLNIIFKEIIMLCWTSITLSCLVCLIKIDKFYYKKM